MRTEAEDVPRKMKTIGVMKNSRFKIKNGYDIALTTRSFPCRWESNSNQGHGSKILVIGLAYKPDVDDMRESPTFKIFDLLKKSGAEVSYFDPYLPVIPKNRDNMEWTGTESIEWNKEIVSGFDAVIISTNHSSIDYTELAEWSGCIVDTRNAMSGVEAKEKNHIFKA